MFVRYRTCAVSQGLIDAYLGINESSRYHLSSLERKDYLIGYNSACNLDENFKSKVINAYYKNSYIRQKEVEEEGRRFSFKMRQQLKHQY